MNFLFNRTCDIVKHKSAQIDKVEETEKEKKQHEEEEKEEEEEEQRSSLFLLLNKDMDYVTENHSAKVPKFSLNYK